MDLKDLLPLAAAGVGLLTVAGGFAVKKPAACMRVATAVKSVLLLPTVGTAGALGGAWWMLRNTGIRVPVIGGERALLDAISCPSSAFLNAVALPDIDPLAWCAGVLLFVLALAECSYRLAKVVHLVDQDVPVASPKSREDA